MTHTDSAEMVSAVKKFAAFPAAVSAAGDASLGKFRSGLRAASLFGDKAFAADELWSSEAGLGEPAAASTAAAAAAAAATDSSDTPASLLNTVAALQRAEEAAAEKRCTTLRGYMQEHAAQSTTDLLG